MPVQVGYQIAKRGDIHFRGLKGLSQDCFDRQHHIQKVVLITARKIGHFAHMCAPNNPAEIADAGNLGGNNDAVRIGPKRASRIQATQGAFIGFGHATRLPCGLQGLLA